MERAQLVCHLAAAARRAPQRRGSPGGLARQRSRHWNVLAACFRYGRRALLASTSEVSGKTAKVPMQECDDRVLGPTPSTAGRTRSAKAIDEHLPFAYGAYGQLTVVRYFNSYSGRLDARDYGSVLGNCLRQALAGKPITVHGDGSQTRCFMYLDDPVEGTMLAATTSEAEGHESPREHARDVALAAGGDDPPANRFRLARRLHVLPRLLRSGF